MPRLTLGAFSPPPSPTQYHGGTLRIWGTTPYTRTRQRLELPALAPHSLPATARSPPSPFGAVLCTTLVPLLLGPSHRPQSNSVCTLSSGMRPRLGQIREQVKSSLPSRSHPRQKFDLLTHPSSTHTTHFLHTAINQPTNQSNQATDLANLTTSILNFTGSRMKTSIVSMLLLLALLPTTALPTTAFARRVTRSVTKVAAEAAAAGGGAAVLGPLAVGPVGGAAAVVGMVWTLLLVVVRATAPKPLSQPIPWLWL